MPSVARYFDYRRIRPASFVFSRAESCELRDICALLVKADTQAGVFVSASREADGPGGRHRVSVCVNERHAVLVRLGLEMAVKYSLLGIAAFMCRGVHGWDVRA